MLTSSALSSLSSKLRQVLAGFELQTREPIQAEFVRKATEESARLFQEYAKARPSKEDAYAAAAAFLRGQRLDEEALHLVTGALNVRVREASGRRVISSPRFGTLLDTYRRSAQAGDLWLLTWFGLLCSYFDFNPQGADEATLGGFSELRRFLQETWPAMDREAGTEVVPDWIRVIRSDPKLLGENAADRYGLDFLHGDDAEIQRLSTHLGIPESSWFWHALVLAAVQRSTRLGDAAFKESIPRLLELVQSRPVFRDEALEAMLTRYERCVQHERHTQLRDYVVRKDVWRNPKLRAAGLATAWNRVSDNVWRMVLQWVNEANLKDFFEVLTARRNSDEGRLDFWSQYIDQISWTRLIFSVQTKQLARSNEAIRNLIAREEDSYATLSSNADVDAFMMQLGNYMVVEFSRQPNAAYVYKVDELPFEPYAREYSGTSADLKYGYQNECVLRITHQQGWQMGAAADLHRLGIRPDTHRPQARRVAAESDQRSSGARSGIRSAQTGAAPTGAPFSMTQLQALVVKYPAARIDDARREMSGRLWVRDPKQRAQLGLELKQLGFQWGSRETAWYYPER